MDDRYVTPDVFIAFVDGRGYKAEPITNDLAMELDGVPERIVGYTLRGPRGNKTVVTMNTEGLLALSDAKLWCDGVDYATANGRKRIAATKSAIRR